MISPSILATTDASQFITRQATRSKTRLSQQEQQLSKEELELIARLKRRDREVRAHEQAHRSAAGQYAQGGPTYTYQKGPDGKNYAVGGEVQIDTSPVRGDPEATLRKAEQVRRAANAPASPSSQDRTVAAEAAALAIQARIEISRQQQQKQEDENDQNRTSNLVNTYLLSSAYRAEKEEIRLLDELI